MLEIKINGRGILREYSDNIEVEETATIRDVLEILQLPADKRENLLVIRNGRAVSLSDTVTDKDELKLFSMLPGG